MTKKNTATLPAPTSIHAGTTAADVMCNVRVVDAGTGADIARIVSADAEAGKLTRFDVDDAGNLVRVDNAFVIHDEDRAIRIEWIDPPAEPASIAGGDAA